MNEKPNYTTFTFGSRPASTNIITISEIMEQNEKMKEELKVANSMIAYLEAKEKMLVKKLYGVKL